jgi:hypothetical protein
MNNNDNPIIKSEAINFYRSEIFNCLKELASSHKLARKLIVSTGWNRETNTIRLHQILKNLKGELSNG